MKYKFFKEPGNLLPFTMQVEGVPEDLPERLQPILSDMVKRPAVYSAPPAAPSPDADNYTLILEDDGKTHTFRFRDLAIPAEASPLVDYLRQRLK
jgi:hypothetical protein